MRQETRDTTMFAPDAAAGGSAVDGCALDGLSEAWARGMSLLAGDAEVEHGCTRGVRRCTALLLVTGVMRMLLRLC